MSETEVIEEMRKRIFALAESAGVGIIACVAPTSREDAPVACIARSKDWAISEGKAAHMLCGLMSWMKVAFGPKAVDRALALLPPGMEVIGGKAAPLASKN